MKYLKLFESFNKEDINSICRKYNIFNYTINDDMSIDVNKGTGFGVNLTYGENLNIFDSPITKIPLKFRNVEAINLGGVFSCFGNPINQLWRLFEDKDKIELFNDFGITDGEVIILDRLNEFLKIYFS